MEMTVARWLRTRSRTSDADDVARAIREGGRLEGADLDLAWALTTLMGRCHPEEPTLGCGVLVDSGVDAAWEVLGEILPPGLVLDVPQDDPRRASIASHRMSREPTDWATAVQRRAAMKASRADLDPHTTGGRDRVREHLERFPNDGIGWATLAVLLDESEQEAAVTKALALRPYHSDANRYVALQWVDLNHNRSRQYLERAIQGDPTHVRTAEDLAEMHEVLGNPPESAFWATVAMLRRSKEPALERIHDLPGTMATAPADEQDRYADLVVAYAELLTDMRPRGPIRRLLRRARAALGPFFPPAQMPGLEERLHARSAAR